jgi:hypothetical protein
VGLEVQFHTVLTLALDGGDWSASRFDRFTPVKELPVAIVQETKVYFREEEATLRL